MRRSIKLPAAGAIAAALGLGAMLAGCSDIYFDRRETVLFGADNAVAANIAVQTRDPWPPASANRNAPANGERVAAAIWRYRTGRVYTPVGTQTSTTYQQQQQAQQMQQAQQAAGSAAGGAGTPPK
jgi:hypothetical protein